MPNLNSKIQNLKSFLAAAVSGVLLVICFPKAHLPGLVWVASLPLLWVLANETRLKHAFLLGYVCGAFFFAGSCYWFVTVMEFYGHLAPVLAVIALILFVLLDATFFGGFGLAMGWAAQRSRGWALALSPLLWMAMELARTYLITGFPWNLLGYAVQAEGIRQIASVTGVYGLSFLAVATSALLTWLFISPRRAHAGMALAGWAALLLLAQWKLAPPPPTEGKELAILIQPNVPLDESELNDWVPWRNPAQLRELVQFSVAAVKQFSPENVGPGGSTASGNHPVAQRATPPKSGGEPGKKLPSSDEEGWRLERRGGAEQEAFPQAEKPGSTSNASRGLGVTRPIADSKFKIQDSEPTIQNPKGNPPLLVWAENPAPFYFTRDPVFRSAMENMARQTHTIVIANTIVPVDSTGDIITNTAVTLDSDGRQVSRYDKIHLVPFGEYVPWWALPGLVHKITSDVGNFVSGSSYPVAIVPGGRIGVFICYEAIIPQLARKLVTNGAGVLVNISNDAWYGDSAAAYQHLEMARLRAIENHRYLLRATDNGVTTFIDPYGQVREQLPRYQRLALPAHFDYETRQTFYTKYGDVFAWTCAAMGVLGLLGAVRTKSKG